MNIQGFQKLTLLDFPGKTACTVFTGGCNLRCPFCHNATLVKSPFESANMADGVLSYLKKRQGLLDGVCITGGEPLLQPDLADFILSVKEMGYAVKLDTNGTLPQRLKAILPMVDYVAMDIKAGFDNYYAATLSLTEPSVFKESIDLIKAFGVPHEFRTTAVKGIHSAKDFVSIASYLKGEKRYFIQKFKDSGNLLEGGAGFSDEELAYFLSLVKEIIPEAEIRG